MKQKIIIFGIEQFGEIIYDYLQNHENYEVVAFTADSDYIKSSSFLNLPLVDFRTIEQHYSPSDHQLFICVGYTNMNRVREQKIKESKIKGYKLPNYIHPTAINLSSELGEGNFIMEGSILGHKTKIGNGNVFWPASHVAHHTTVDHYNFFTISVSVAGNIHIKNNCVFGNNCTIRNNVNIENYTLIGANAYIDKNTKEESVHVPARSICLETKRSFDMNI